MSASAASSPRTSPRRLARLLLLALVAACEMPPGATAVPQRPTFTFGPGTTAAGTFEVEAGIQAGPPEDDAEIPTTLKYGWDERTEVGLSVSPLIGVDHHTGLGDTVVHWRRRFVDAEGARPAVAAHASVKMPSADEDRGLGTGEVDAFGALTVGGTRGAFGWNVYAGLGALGQDGESSDLERDLALLGSWTLDATNALFAELSDRRVPEQDSHVDQLRLGHSLTVRPDLILDLSVWLPLSDDSPEAIVAVGFTRNLGARPPRP